MAKNLLLAEQISKTFGEKSLFEGITLGIAEGQKIALIARNGSGKTSLLNILTGKEEADEGKVSQRNDTRIAYLEQQPYLPENASILDAIFHTANEFTLAVRNYEAASILIRKNNDALHQDQLNESIAVMDRLNAWDYEARVKEVLGRFAITDLEASCNTLSGGQKKKVALARTLLEPADILILDEPTNHLDITMIEWLEEYLAREKQSLLMVTHDRYFLSRVCNEVVELDRGRLHHYKGDYNYYLEKKSEREQVESKEIEKARGLMRKELEWMRRSPPARTTKSKARIDSFYELEEKAGQRGPEKQAAFQVKGQRMGGKILEIHNLSKAYGENVLIDDFTYIFKKNEKVGIAGANGTGKSTLLNLISGLVKADKGSITIGQTVQFAYYTQDGLQVEGNKRVLELVKDIAEEVTLNKGSMSASQFLTYFGFGPELQFNYFENLSGGEKRKLYLLMTLISSPNFLILDEPTNDLDIHTLNLLEDFLQAFDGCLLIVSHDRYFMDKLVDHLFIFEGEGRIRDFYGNYTEYHLQQKTKARIKPTNDVDKPAKLEREKPAGKVKLSWKEEKEFEQLENDIAALEQEKAKLIAGLETEREADKLQQMSERIGEILSILEEKELRWLELSEKKEPDSRIKS